MTECIYDYETNIRKRKSISKDDELAAKTKRQVDNAVSWLEKRYFTEEVRAKKQLNESAGHFQGK